MRLGIENIIDLEDYADKESYITPADQVIITSLTAQSTNIQNVSGTIDALNEIKIIIVKNKDELDLRLESAEYAKIEIKKEIDLLNGPNTINTLYNSGINPQIFSICVAEYNLYYTRIQELKYRLEILSYKTLFIEAQQKIADEKIEFINKYIIALEAL